MKRHILERHGVKWPPGYLNGDCAPCCNPPPPPPPPPLAAYYSPYGYAGRNFAPCRCAGCAGAVWGDTGFGQGVIPADVACSWMLEVSGVTSVTPPSPCSYAIGGDGCANMNGTWRMEPWCLYQSTAAGACYTCLFQPEDYEETDPNIVWGCCLWRSSNNVNAIVAQGPNPSLPECLFCFSSEAFAWGYFLWALKAFDITTGEVVDEKAYVTIETGFRAGSGWSYRPFIWKRTSALPCKGIAEFQLIKDAYHTTDPVAAVNSPFCCDGVPTTVYAFPF